MSVKPEHLFGGALHRTVTADTSFNGAARVMSFNSTGGGGYRVEITTDLADLMSKSNALGGPFAYVINTGGGNIDFEMYVGGEQISFSVANNETFKVCTYDLSNLKTGEAGAAPLSATKAAKASGATVGKIIQDTDGVVHNGGNPGAKSVETVDLPTGTWASATSSPNNHGDAAGFGLRQSLHLIGNNGANPEKHSRFRDGAWVSRADVAVPTDNACGGSLGDLGYIFSGDIGEALADKPIATVDYNDTTDAYSSKASMPHPTERSGTADVPAWDRIMIVRGDPLQQASWLYHGLSGTFESVDFYSGVARRSMSCFERLGKVYSCGGFDDGGGEWSQATDIFDIATRSWSTGPTMPAQRSEGAAFAWHEVGIYAGGEDSGSTAVNTVFRMNSSSAWFTTTAKSGTVDRASQHGAEIRV